MGRPPLPPDQRKPKLSGSQRRKLKHQREDEDDAARERTAPTPPKSDGEDIRWAKEFEAAGEIDLENPDTDLAYVRKLQLICLKQMATTAHPSKAQQDAWRRIREMSATVGLTSNRAKLESDLREVKKQLAVFKERHGALKTEPGHAVVRPGTSRGQRSPRGPRPLGPGAGAPPGEDA